MGVGVQGVFLRSNGVDRRAEQYGTMALVTAATSGVTYRTAWAKLNWGGSLLDFWDDLSSDGMLENREIAGVDDPMASLAVSMDVPPQGTQEVTFLLTWHFPNRQTWTPARKPEAQGGSTEGTRSDADRIGNYYTTQYSDALDVAAQTAARLVDLEAETMLFVRSLCDSELPTIVKEAALYNLSTLRTQTCFRTEDGRFYGWEGCDDKHGWCHGSCTHVWNYEQATAFLFGELACS